MDEYAGAIVDVDGTLVRGSQIIPGARDGLAALTDAGIEPLLFSNNPTRSPDYYRDRLLELDLPVAETAVLTAAETTARHLLAEHAGDNVYVVGSNRLRARLLDAGLDVVTDPKYAEVVVVSVDETVDYSTLRRGRDALANASYYIGTDPDPTIPTEQGLAPGSGAIIAALNAMTDREPDAFAGKPSAIARKAALAEIGASPEDMLVIGDRPGTDIEMGNRAGMTTVLVRSGVSNGAPEGDGPNVPDHVVDSIADIGPVLADGQTP